MGNSVGRCIAKEEAEKPVEGTATETAGTIHPPSDTAADTTAFESEEALQSETDASETEGDLPNKTEPANETATSLLFQITLQQIITLQQGLCDSVFNTKRYPLMCIKKGTPIPQLVGWTILGPATDFVRLKFPGKKEVILKRRYHDLINPGTVLYQQWDPVKGEFSSEAKGYRIFFPGEGCPWHLSRGKELLMMAHAEGDQAVPCKDWVKYMAYFGFEQPSSRSRFKQRYHDPSSDESGPDSGPDSGPESGSEFRMKTAVEVIHGQADQVVVLPRLIQDVGTDRLRTANPSEQVLSTEFTADCLLDFLRVPQTTTMTQKEMMEKLSEWPVLNWKDKVPPKGPKMYKPVFRARK